MMIHPDWVNVIRELFAGVRSLGVAGHGGVFVVGWAFGWAFGWAVLYVRRKLKIG